MVQMEKLVKQCDIEVMKMAMLKHEETFRQQVHELHRLYRIQKQLMSDLNRSEMTCRRQRRKQARRALKLQLPADEYIVVGADEGGKVTPPWREDELELTLAVGGSVRRRKLREGEGTSDCSGGSQTSSSSTDSDGALRPVPYHQRAMAFDVQEGMVMKQPPWLVQCLSLRMA